MKAFIDCALDVAKWGIDENYLYVIGQEQPCKAAIKDGSGDMGVSSHDVCC